MGFWEGLGVGLMLAGVTIFVWSAALRELPGMDVGATVGEFLACLGGGLTVLNVVAVVAVALRRRG